MIQLASHYLGEGYLLSPQDHMHPHSCWEPQGGRLAGGVVQCVLGAGGGGAGPTRSKRRLLLALLTLTFACLLTPIVAVPMSSTAQH